MQSRAADYAALTGEALGWTPDNYRWPALAEPAFCIEAIDGNTVWRFPARVAFHGDRLTFQATGPAHGAVIKGG